MKTNSRFTLIELLVVIAIIAILAAILMPALQQARERAMATKCVSNLKNNGTLARMYTDSHRDFWPGGDLTNSTNGALPWFVELAKAKIMGGPTTRSWNVNRDPSTICPSMPQVPGTWMSEAYGSERAQIGTAYPTFPFYNVDDAGLARAYDNSRFDVGPSERVWLIDTANTFAGDIRSNSHWIGNADPSHTMSNNWYGYPISIHSGRMNLLSFAGAVTSVQPRDLYSWWTVRGNGTQMCSIKVKIYLTPATGTTILSTYN